MTDREKARDLAAKQIFTTGEAAELCQCSQQTIIRCFDSGRIKGFRVPGSRFRRIPREDLIQFIQASEIPSALCREGDMRVLVIESDDGPFAACTALGASNHGITFQFVNNGFDAGIAMSSWKPDVLLLDLECCNIDAVAIRQRIREEPNFADVRIVLATRMPNTAIVETLVALGVDGVCLKPFGVDALRAVLNERVTA